MKIFRQIRIVFSSFSNKIIRRISFGNNGKKTLKGQVSTIVLNNKSNIFTNKNGPGEHCGRNKCAIFVEEIHFEIVRLRLGILFSCG